jgi:hypothetical protein
MTVVMPEIAVARARREDERVVGDQGIIIQSNLSINRVDADDLSEDRLHFWPMVYDRADRPSDF